MRAIATALAAMLAALVGAVAFAQGDDDVKDAFAQCNDDDVKDDINNLLRLEYLYSPEDIAIGVVSAIARNSAFARNNELWSCGASILFRGEEVAYIEYHVEYFDDRLGMDGSALYGLQGRGEREAEQAGAQPIYVACYGGAVFRRRNLVSFDGTKAGAVGEDVFTWTTKALPYYPADAVDLGHIRFNMEQLFQTHLDYAHGYGYHPAFYGDDYDTENIHNRVACLSDKSQAKLAAQVDSLADPDLFWKPRQPTDDIALRFTEPCEHDHWR